MDPTATASLTRILTHLGATLSSPAADRLIHSPHLRTKTAQNLGHARALLLTLEAQRTATRAQSQQRKSAQPQPDLVARRAELQHLAARLQDLRDRAVDDDDDDNDDDGKDELSVMTGVPQTVPTQLKPPAPAAPPELRARKPPPPTTSPPASTTTARTQLLGPRSPTDSTLPHTSAPTEARLSHHRAEQATLTTSLLSLAGALRASSERFAAALEAERAVLGRAEAGLDKGARGVEAAGRRMGLLRRVSEGQGWWGRMKLYACIGALWVGCFLLVFVGPKVRL